MIEAFHVLLLVDFFFFFFVLVLKAEVFRPNAHIKSYLHVNSFVNLVLCYCLSYTGKNRLGV